MGVFKTYSENTHANHKNETDSLYRAARNEWLLYDCTDDLTAIRNAYPNVKVAAYGWFRLLSSGDASIWDTYAGVDNEQGYLHVGGADEAHRRTISSRYPMNMGNALFRQWMIDASLKLLDGTYYGEDPHPGLIMDAVLHDVTPYYPAFDPDPYTTTEGIPLTDEYTDDAATYETDCAEAFAEVSAAVLAVYPDVKVMPNFGNPSFVDYAASDATYLAASDTIEVQECMYYASNEPNLTATACEAAWTRLTTTTAGKTVFGHVRMADAGTLAIAKLGAAAFFAMAARDGLYLRFQTHGDESGDIADYEQNDLFTKLDAELGNPTGPYTVVSGTWTKGKLYRRVFENGEALFYARVSAGTDPATVTVPVGWVYTSDGYYSGEKKSVTLTIGQGAVILYRPASSPIFTKGTARFGRRKGDE